MVQIAPSVLSADFGRLAGELAATEEAGADMFHVDVMDGRFVPNITIGPFIVEAIKKNARLPLDVHLMIEEPARYVRDFVNAGADYVSVHIEADPHLNRTVSLIKECGAKAGVALNPATPISSLGPIIKELDMALLMSVNPGFGGQSFIEGSLERIRALRELIDGSGSAALLEVDGGVKPDNAKDVALAGAQVLVMGSAFYGQGDYADLMQRLRALLGDA